jgi:hypothetical protein
MICYRLNKMCPSRILVWHDSTLPGTENASAVRRVGGASPTLLALAAGYLGAEGLDGRQDFLRLSHSP